MKQGERTSPEDEKKVVNALAKGKSQRKAIEGTKIKAKETAKNIEKRNLAEISQKREDYLQTLEEYGATDEKTAQVYGEALDAKKIHGTTDDFIEIPDHRIRTDTAKYVDSLKGRGEKAVGVRVGGGTIEVVVTDYVG